MEIIMFKKLLAFIIISTVCLQAQACSKFGQLTRRVTVAAFQTKRITTTEANKVFSRNYQKEAHDFWKNHQQNQDTSKNIALGMYAGIPVTWIVGLMGHYCF
jgi:hypothetical protein